MPRITFYVIIIVSGIVRRGITQNIECAQCVCGSPSHYSALSRGIIHESAVSVKFTALRLMGFELLFRKGAGSATQRILENK